MPQATGSSLTCPLTASFRGHGLLGEAFVCNLWASLARVDLGRSTGSEGSGS
jgi:hypothetical protein